MLLGREGKLDSLEKNWASDGARFVVIYGGRRTGKTKFLGEFSKGKNGIFFSAQRINSFANLRLLEKAISEYSGESEHFDINGYKKHCLMNGLDDIDFLVQNQAKIEEWELRNK